MELVLVALDIRSAHNVGSILRTCDGFGADALLVGISPYPQHEQDVRLPHIAARAHKEIAKTALGAEQSVRWRHVSNFSDAMKLLRAEGYRIVAIEQHATSMSLLELHAEGKLAVVVGREVEGMSIDEIAQCDAVYEIPMIGSKESFNVAIAAGIALYQARCLR